MAAGAHSQTPSLYTKDGKCRYYYFTPKNTQSWYITASDGLCDNGLVDGQGAVTVYNAFSQPIEEIYGFFTEGYWTGDMPLSASVLYQTVQPDGTQKVYFELPNETYYNFQLIGQMSAQKQKDGTYEAFKFCNPFRILLQTDEAELFSDNQKLIEIVDALVKQTRNYCPAEETLYFYASRLERPNLDDIFFFAEVDLRAARITIKRNIPIPGDTLQPGIGSPSLENFMEESAQKSNSSVSYQNQVPQNGLTRDGGGGGFPTRQEEQSIQRVQDNRISNMAAGREKSQKPTDSIKEQQGGSIAQLEKNSVANIAIKKVADKNASVEWKGDEPGTAGEDNPSKSINEIDKVPHLLLSAKIMHKPVSGTAALYISDVNDNTGHANKPNPLQLTGENLTIGWALVSGDFDYQSTSNSGKLRGRVVVKSIVPCQKKLCKDIK